MNEELFHRLAEEVEHDYQLGGLSGGLYEDYAHDILERYLAAQQGVQRTCDHTWVDVVGQMDDAEVIILVCSKCGTIR